MTENPWRMPGTEGTGEYVVVANAAAGRVGYRLLEGGSVRVRVEPSGPDALDILAPAFHDWKQPDVSGIRFSTVKFGGDDPVRAVVHALKALKATVADRNPKLNRLWRKPLRDHAAMPDAATVTFGGVEGDL